MKYIIQHYSGAIIAQCRKYGGLIKGGQFNIGNQTFQAEPHIMVMGHLLLVMISNAFRQVIAASYNHSSHGLCAYFEATCPNGQFESRWIGRT